MKYKFKAITIRTKNNEEGVKSITALWEDIFSDKIVMESKKLISKYSNYESDQNGYYDLTIMTMDEDLIKNLEKSVKKGEYLKYNAIGKTPDATSKEAWEKVWIDSQEKILDRIFSEDYEISFPIEDRFCTEVYIAIK